MSAYLVDKKQTKPATMKKPRHLDIIQYTLLMVFFIWLFSKSVENLGYNWQWYQVQKYLYSFDNTGFHAGPLLNGLKMTLVISGVSLILSLCIGLVVALLRLSNAPIARLCARIYLEIIRNTPLLIQIFFIYFVLGPVLDLKRFSSAVLALSLFEGAYISEIFRSGILSVSTGQKEAGYSLGLNGYLTYRHIILPQAVRNMLPPLTNQIISLVKDSALVSTIAIYDLTMQAQSIIAETYLTFEIWFTIALIYLFVNVSLSFVSMFVAKRLLPAHNFR